MHQKTVEGTRRHQTKAEEQRLLGGAARSPIEGSGHELLELSSTTS
jgi:hypothetical protein